MLFSIKDSIKSVQDYLRSGKTFDDFNTEHGIRAKTDGNHILLDYNQITVKWTEPFGYVCRGLVLDAHTFDVLGFGLAKFFNADEGYAAKIDWETARVVEKLDGSMFNRWYSPHTKRFEYTTRFQLPHELDINTVGGFPITWRQLLEEAKNNCQYQNVFGESHTVVYEVMSNYNQIVVRQDKPRIRMIAARNIQTLQEEDIYIERLRSMVPTNFNLSNPEDLKVYINGLVGSKCEGGVAVDANFNRQKYKCPSYVYMHHLKDSAQSIKSLLCLARNGEKEEVIAYFPEYLGLFNDIEKMIDSFVIEHSVVYEMFKHLESQKEFALAIKDRRLAATSLLFNVRAGKSSTIKEALMAIDETQFVKLLKPLMEENKKLYSSIPMTSDDETNEIQKRAA